MGTTAFSITTFSIRMLSIKGLFVTLSIATRCHYSKWRSAECQILFNAMLSVVMLNGVMINVVDE